MFFISNGHRRESCLATTKKEPCINRKSPFCLFCTRENILLGYRGHSWVPRADSVTGLRTSDWNPSRNKVTRLSCFSLPPFPLGSLVTPGTFRLARVATWPQVVFGGQFSEQGRDVGENYT